MPKTPVGNTAAEDKRAFRILIVEDNLDTAESLRLLLEVHGHKVRVVADSGTVAIEMALAHRPDVALIDIGLPGMDGYEVAKGMRLQPALRPATLVALTGYGRDQDRSAAIAAGFDHYLVKPVEPDDLEKLIQRLVRPDESAIDAVG
jgi:CheY-like chemotaxis protein